MNFRRKHVRVPTVLQMEAVECGAASLAMILAFHGRFVSLEQLRVECGVSRDGTKALNILQAARRYGLGARGFKKEIDGLKQTVMPVILFWNFNHFVVCEGFGGGGVYLNDPACGRVRVSNEEFDRAFTGVVLTFEKTGEFRRGGSRPSLLRSLAARLPGSLTPISFLMLATLGLVFPGLIAPAFQRIFVDNILIGGSGRWLSPLLLAIAATAILRALLTALQQRTLLRLETRLAIEGSSRFLSHLFRLPMDFFLQRTAADIAARVSINDRVASLLSGELATSAVSIVTAAFYALLMFRYDVTLAMLGVAIALTNLLMLRYVSRKRTESNQRLQQDRGRLMGTSMNGLLSIETLKATGSEGDFFTKWSGIQANVATREQSMGVTGEVLSSLPALLLAINMAALMALGGSKVMDGVLTMGMLVAFQSLLYNFLAPVNQLVRIGDALPEAHAEMKRLDDVLNYPATPGLISAVPQTAISRRLEGDLQLSGITFGYSRLIPPLIEDFSLTVQAGRRVALVGGSGSGKSTVARIVAGLYEPWAGEVLFDGEPRRHYPREVMNSSLAMVDQDIFLFEGTVRENLSLWDEQFEEPSILSAARDACIHEDIAARPGGYDSIVEESGRNFSGGQRQRLEIARALVGEPRILILDEATSALDPQTEMLLDDNLRRRGCTCLIVAHRLSTIRDCDEIIVMHMGRVVERGTHEDLLSTGSHYARLVSGSPEA